MLTTKNPCIVAETFFFFTRAELKMIPCLILFIKYAQINSQNKLERHYLNI